MSASTLRQSQWDGYARYHQSRGNLPLHIVFVPLFLASNLALLAAIGERGWPAATRRMAGALQNEGGQ